MTKPSWLSCSLRPFFYSSSVYSCQLFLIASASTKSLSFLSFIVKCSLGIFNFLEEISNLSHSIIFLYFFSLFAYEGFLISPFYSLELFIQMGISSLSPLPLASLLFSAICKASSDKHFAFLHFFFLGIVLVTTSYTML